MSRGLRECFAEVTRSPASSTASDAVGPQSKFLVQPPGPWVLDKTCNMRIASSPHTGGIDAAMGDGSVRFINSSISGDNWWAACTASAGDLVNLD